MIPAQSEESRIMNLELLMIWASSKASKVTKIDIVKPIPPRIATPNNSVQLMFLGSSQMPNFTAMNVNKVIPIGFPITNPKKIPLL